MLISPRPVTHHPTPTSLLGLPAGRAGVSATLRIMAQIVKKEKININLRELALSIVAPVPAKCWICEAKAIQKYIHEHIRYVKDIAGIETVAFPQKTLEYRQGDCDDMAVLAATLLQAIGHPVRFVAMGFHGKPLSHVLVETIVGGTWMPMELTASIPLGQYPVPPTTTLIRNIK